MNAVLKVIDTELALERAAGNEELAKELFDMLLKELPVYRSELQLCLADKNLTRMQEQIHKLNGATTYTGVPALKAATNDFETKLKRGETEDIKALVKGMLQEIDQVMVSVT